MCACFDKLYAFQSLSISNTDSHNYREIEISLGQLIREFSKIDLFSGY